MMKPNRRIFVKQVSALAATLSLTPTFARELTTQKKSKMKLGLVTYNWGKDWDVPTLIKNCTKSGITGVELRSTHAHGVEPTLSAAQRAEVKKQFDDSEVQLVSLGTAEEYNHPDQERLNKAIEDTKSFIKLAQDVGATGIKVRPNKLYEDIPHKKTIEQIGQSLNIVGKYAADHGQNIRVEVHGSGTSHLPVMKQIFDHVTEKSVGMCWNCNEQDLQGNGFDHNFDLVKDRLGDTVHVRELNVGEYPYQQLMSKLVQIKYDGWILLECRTQPEDRVKALIEQREIWERMIGV